MSESRYKLTPGSQVREEDFGLLFYTMSGPKLYFLSSGELIGDDFFDGEMSIDGYIHKRLNRESVSEGKLVELKKGLNNLIEKGVICEL